ncbi:MAG: hypothetical protein KDA57_19460 [Planctomycetales bacterium]|nr:hypothetical protein [Planctomycetales bacterium]
MLTTEFEEAVREVLVQSWDPIGIKDDPEWPKDEYDAYISEICAFLLRGEPDDFIARHLCFIEKSLMGLGSTGVSERLPVARKLKAVGARYTSA